MDSSSCERPSPMPRLEETNFIDALVASGVPRENIVIVPTLSDRIELPFHDTEPDILPSHPQDDVILSAQSIATVPDSNGYTTTIVLFKPTPATRKFAKEYEDQDVALHISDTNGQFTPQRPQRITGSVYGDGNNTLLVYTENQS
jgi:hypothetical protein